MISLDSAIYAGVMASFAVFLWNSARPELVITAPTTMRNGRRKFRDVRRHALPECPQIVTLRLDGPLYFASVDHVEAAFRRIEQAYPVPPNIVLVLKGGGTVDLAGADLLIRKIRSSFAQKRDFRIVADSSGELFVYARAVAPRPLPLD